MSEINQSIAKIIADFCIFLEFSDSKTIDPDAAVQMMEQLAVGLQELSENDKGSLCMQFKVISENYDAEKASFVLNLPDGLGLIDD